MDELAKRFFADPTAYARAAELLGRYEAVEHLNWEAVEDYLAGLDEGETALLDTALSHRKALLRENQALLDKIALQEQTIQALTRGSPAPIQGCSILNKPDAEVSSGHSLSSYPPPPQLPLEKSMTTTYIWLRLGKSSSITSDDSSRRGP